MWLSKFIAVCVTVVAICGCDRSDRDKADAIIAKLDELEKKYPPVATPMPSIELPESTDAIGLMFKVLPAGSQMYTFGS